MTSADLRIVSLLPSATEIVAGLGLGHALVGRSHECDFPPGIEALPVLTAPKLDPSGGSREIHDAVTGILADGLSVYCVDAALLASLSPTHVVTQVHCEVCAVSLADVRAATAEWKEASDPPDVVALGASTLDGVFADFRRVGSALGVPERAAAMEAAARDRMAKVEERALGATRRPRVAAIEWLDPLMAAGNWIPELIEMAGGRSVFGRAGVHSEWLEPDALVRADPDVVVVFPCGFSLERAVGEIGLLFRAVPDVDRTRAGREGAVFAADGHQLFNRPGPRLVESLETLAEILHPELFPPRGRGRFWTSTATSVGPVSSGRS